MQRLVFSTDDVPESERFSFWRGAVLEGLIGSSAEPVTDRETPFSGRLEASIGQSFVKFRFRSDGVRVSRRPGDIARRAWDSHLLLFREAGAGAWFDYANREFVTRPGDLAVIDVTIPFATEARESYNLDMLLIPRKILEPHLPVSLRPRSLTLAGSNGINGMVKTYFDAFAGQIETFDEREAAVVGDNFCRLLAVACGAAAAGEHQESIRLARLEEAKRHIEFNLTDPTLTPEKAAKALKISARSLHLLFEPSGTTFSQYVLHRRLEECRAALVNQGNRSVTDIAFAWGFNSLATFYRAFQQAFGAAPGEMRMEADRARQLAGFR
jgi:AraC-like DNA-binding protein